MSFRNLFSGKKRLDLSKRSAAVRSLVTRTIGYLQKRANEDPNAQIRPAMLAQAIKVNEMIALTALSILQDAGVTKAHIGLYCSATMQPMGGGEAGSPQLGALRCNDCGEQHDLGSGTMRKEIFFTFDSKALAEIKEAA